MNFGRLGALFGRLGSRGAGASRPSAPVLAMDPAWISSDNTPDFTIDVDETVTAGDAVTLQVQASGGNWSSLVVNSAHTITSGEDSANQVDLATGAIAGGSYEARAKVHHNSDSAWSNTVSFTITATASTFYILGF